MKKWSLRASLIAMMLTVTALMLTYSDSADAGGKAAANHQHLDAAIKKLRDAEKALFDAGAKESKQKNLELGVIGELNAALRHTRNAISHTTRARNLDGNVK